MRWWKFDNDSNDGHCSKKMIDCSRCRGAGFKPGHYNISVPVQSRCNCNPWRTSAGGNMNRIWPCILIIVYSVLFPPSLILAQTKPLKEVRVPYALGGSTGFFWV